MVASCIDSSLLKIASKNGLYYTRYADDITISSRSDRQISSLISFSSSTAQWAGILIDAITDAGFEINPSKVRIQRHHQRQEVTGLTVNRFPNKRREYIDKIRGALSSWENHGYEAACSKLDSIKGSGNHDISAFVSGCLAHLCDVRGRNDPLFCKLMKRYAKIAGIDYRCYESALEQFLDSLLIVYNATGQEIGTAFLLYGYGITTCDHVAQEASFVSHWEPNSKKHLAHIKTTSVLHDISLLQSQTFPVNSHVHLRLSESKIYPSGSKYYFAGFPNYNGLDQPKLYPGRIINRTLFFELWYYRLDKDVFGGASGAPLVDKDFKVFGIVVRGLGSDFKPGDTDANLAIDIKYLEELS